MDSFLFILPIISRTEWDLKKHRRKEHFSRREEGKARSRSGCETGGPLVCEECGQEFQDRAVYRNHQKSAHQVEKQKHSVHSVHSAPTGNSEDSSHRTLMDNNFDGK